MMKVPRRDYVGIYTPIEGPLQTMNPTTHQVLQLSNSPTLSPGSPVAKLHLVGTLRISAWFRAEDSGRLGPF